MGQMTVAGMGRGGTAERKRKVSVTAARHRDEDHDLASISAPPLSPLPRRESLARAETCVEALGGEGCGVALTHRVILRHASTRTR